MIIGLTGYAQSGKDTVASLLVEHYGFTRVAFADKIREFLYEANPLVACSHSGYLRDLVNLEGWEKAKQSPQVRRLLQDTGVGARKIFGEDFWVNQALENVDPYKNNYVITDVRFKNEATAIWSMPGKIWRITRPGVAAVNDHVSETQMDTYPVDHVINNDGDFKDLMCEVAEAIVVEA